MEIVLGRDNYSEVRVREEVIVKIDCSHQLQQFVRTQAITNVSRVTIQWLLQGQLPTLDGFSTQTITLSSGGRYSTYPVHASSCDGDYFLCRIDIVGGFNEIVNITGTQIPTGAVDGTTGIYTCKVCRDRDTPREVCVNSSLPVEGRRKCH